MPHEVIGRFLLSLFFLGIALAFEKDNKSAYQAILDIPKKGIFHSDALRHRFSDTHQQAVRPVLCDGAVCRFKDGKTLEVRRNQNGELHLYPQAGQPLSDEYIGYVMGDDGKPYLRYTESEAAATIDSVQHPDGSWKKVALTLKPALSAVFEALVWLALGAYVIRFIFSFIGSLGTTIAGHNAFTFILLGIGAAMTAISLVGILKIKKWGINLYWMSSLLPLFLGGYANISSAQAFIGASFMIIFMCLLLLIRKNGLSGWDIFYGDTDYLGPLVKY